MKINLTDSEWKIISLLWEQAPRTMTQITAALKEETRWTKHTVMTLLGRMEAKKTIYYTEGKRAKQYFPSIVREETAASEAESFLNKVFDGRMGLMLNTMVNQKAISQEEMNELYEILKQAEGGGK